MAHGESSSCYPSKNKHTVAPSHRELRIPPPRRQSLSERRRGEFEGFDGKSRIDPLRGMTLEIEWHGRLVGLRAALYLIGQNDGLGDVLETLARAPALLLQGEIGVFFVEAEIALQNSLGALD